MIQATTGVWYAYVADDGAAADNPLIDDNEDRLSSAPETSSTVVRGLALAHAPNANQNEGSNPADIENNWPYVQMYDFTSGNDLDVVYGSDKVTVTYDDDLTGSASISLDRDEMAEGNTVHVTISDTRLNMDPTGEDTWRLYTDGVAALAVAGANAGDPPTYPNVTLGSDGHGDLDLPSVLATDPTNYVEVTEDDRNSGAFGSVLDEDDDSSITLSGAQENARHTVSYAGNDDGFIVRDFSTGIAITTADDFWNSGEAATVTLDAKNLDTNTKSSQDITVEGSEVVPTLIFGEPITIENFTPYDYGWLAATADNADNAEGADFNGGENRTTVKGLSTTTVLINNTGDAAVTITNGTSVNGGMDELPDRDDVVIESKIYRLDANIPVGAATTGIILFEIEGAAVSAPFYYVHVSTDTGVTLELVNSANSTDTVTLNDVVTAADDPAAC